MNALIGLRLWVASQPLALRPAWAALAGALAVAAWPPEREALVAALLVIVLVDPLWGAVASRLAGVGRWERVPAEVSAASLPASLPWLQVESPAGRLWRWLDSAPAQAWRDGLVALVGALLLAAWMGVWAVAMTLLVACLAGLLRGVSPSASSYRLVDALISVALPMLAGARSVGMWDTRLVIMAAAFAFLAATGHPTPRRVGLLAAQVALVVALVIFRLPLAAAATALFLLPASLWALQPAMPVGAQALARWRLLTGPWWLLALLVVAWSLR